MPLSGDGAPSVREGRRCQTGGVLETLEPGCSSVDTAGSSDVRAQQVHFQFGKHFKYHDDAMIGVDMRHAKLCIDQHNVTITVAAELYSLVGVNEESNQKKLGHPV